MRSVRSFYGGTERKSFIFWLDRSKLWIIKANKHTECPGDSNPNSKFLRNQSLSAVGLFELPRKVTHANGVLGWTARHLLGSHEQPVPLGTTFTHRAKRRTTRAHPLRE